MNAETEPHRGRSFIAPLARRAVLAAVLSLTIAGTPDQVAASTKYGIKVKVDKHTNFAAFKTYSWTLGRNVWLRDVDEQIMDAVERELDCVGLTRVESGPSDVLVNYVAIGRVDVNVKGKATNFYGSRPQYAVGTVVVVILDPRTQRQLFRGRADLPIVTEPNRLKAEVDAIVAEMFAKYPTRLDEHH